MRAEAVHRCVLYVLRLAAALTLFALLAPAAWAQIAFRAATSSSVTSGTSITLNVPAGTTLNDVMIASIAFRPCGSTDGGTCTKAVTTPTGWTLVDSVDQRSGGSTGGYGMRLYVFRRVATASEPASYAWTISGSPSLTGAVGGILSFSGVDTTNPIVSNGSATNGSSQSIPAPSINAGGVSNTWLVTTHASLSSGTFTPPSGMTERVDKASLAPPNDLGVSIEMNTLSLGSSTGGTGSRTATMANPPVADTGAGESLILRPALPGISGTVFEDLNYGGGAGRNASTAIADGGSARPNARVELYNSGGTFVSSTTTGAAGTYSFTSLASGTYTVRVVNSSVKSTRNTGASALPVQTFRTNASSGAAVAVTDRVGGENPALADAGNGSTTLGALTTSTTTAQSITTVVLSSSSIANVDFGFNFSTIVNTANTGQGSLRQFITNANALGQQTTLSQTGSRVDLSGASVALPDATETSIFMIPSGSATPGHATTHANQLTGGVAVITITSALPTLAANNVAIDGSTQTASVGNTNTGFAGAGGTVGTRSVALAQIPKPEVQIVGNNTITTGLYSSANFTIVRGLAIRGFGSDENSLHADIRVSGQDSLVELNMVGTTAASFADPVTTRTGATGVLIESGNNTVRNNLIGWVGKLGVAAASGSNNLVSGNEIRSVDQMNSGCCGDGVGFGASNTTVSGNLIVNGGSTGIDPVNSNYTITDNTITGNGASTSTGEPWGVWIRAGTHTITHNIIAGNYGAGILVTGAGTSARISQNSIYDNGTITNRAGAAATSQIGIDLNPTGALAEDGVTPNDGAKDNGQPQSGMDFPVITAAGLSGASLTVAGYVGSAAGQSTFAGATVEIFVSDGDASGYGEGRTYLGTLTADASGNFSGTLTVSGVTIGSTRLTATATDASGNTSEFGPAFTVTTPGGTPGRFNAFETSTAAGAISGVIKTKISGTAFSLAVVALNSAASSVLTTFTGTVTVELLDASNNTGALNSTTQCRSSWTSVIATVSPNPAFAGGNNGRITVAFPAVGNAYRDVRVRITYTSGGTTVIGCSNDNFAIRPSSFASVQATDGTDSTTGVARSLNNTSTTSGVVHRAGRAFTVLGTAVSSTGATTTGYDGTPTLGVTTCSVPTGCTAGTLTSSLVASAGTLSGTASYSEAGVITATLSDASFASVDAADSTVAEMTIASGAITIGRFVPDAYRLTTSTTPTLAPPLCGSGPSSQSFVFVGQSFTFGTSPAVLATPINAAGTVIANARPRFGTGAVTTTLSATGAPVAMTGSVTASSVTTSSTASIALTGSSLSFTRGASPVTSFTPTIAMTVDVSDTTETATAGNTAIVDEATLTITPISFSPSASPFYYGRIQLMPTFGDYRRDLVVPLAVQYWNGLGWVPLTAAAACISAAATTFAYSQPTGGLDNGSGAFNCATRVASTVTTSSGRAAITLAKPVYSGSPTPSAATLTLNLLSSASGTSCSALNTTTPATTTGLTWLSWPNGSNPSARVTWGRMRGDSMYLRERFD